MRVESITINNYRSFGHASNTLILNPGVTTIVGMNGSGKSNLIDVIGSINLAIGKNENAKQPNRNRNLDQPVEVRVCLQPSNAEESLHIGDSKTEIIIRENAYCLTGSIADAVGACIEKYDLYAALSRSTKYQGNEKASVLSRVAAIKKYTSTPLQDLKRQAESLKAEIDNRIEDDSEREAASDYIQELIETIGYVIDCLPVFFFYNDRHQMKDKYTHDEVALSQINGKNNSSSLNHNPNDLFLSLIEIAGISRDSVINALGNSDSSARNMFERRANARLEENVMKGFRSFYKNGTEDLKLEFRIDGNLLNVMISVGDTTTTVSERSNGLRWYLNMYIDMMKSVSSNRPIVYVMDEPGIYLHINAQDELRKLLFERGAQSQIIYTTHSPYMIDRDFASIRSITKSEMDGFSSIHNSLYGTDYFKSHSMDTLSPVADALGMSMRLTPGLSSEKLNVIVEGITDQIYLNTMIQKLGYADCPISVVPSSGAQNIKHICSILLGWGFPFVALFDYDNAGYRCCKQVRDEFMLDYSIGCTMLKDISTHEFEGISHIRDEDAVVIESLIAAEDAQRYGLDLANKESKKANAVTFAYAVRGGGQLSQETETNFRAVIERLVELSKKIQD